MASDTPTPPPIELDFTLQLPAGADGNQMALEPAKMVVPPMPGKYFAVQFLSIYARLPAGQFVQCTINGGSGSLFFPVFHQGTFSGVELYVCAQACNFSIVPGTQPGGQFGAARSASTGVGTVSLHLVGTFL